MEQVTIWIFHDNDHGKKLAATIKKLGLNVIDIQGYETRELNIHDEDLNIFILDINNIPAVDLVKKIEKELKFEGSLKFMLLTRNEISRVSNLSFNILHFEFISKPVYLREFLLLLEKSIIAERYREVIRLSARDALSRIEAFEGLMDINRKNVFESQSEKEAFEKILHFEKGLLKKQFTLNKAIREFSKLRQASLYDLKKRLEAEESLDKLRKDELMHAKSVINAQESLIDFSSMRLEETKEILDASQSVAELSRTEAIKLHEELNREKELNLTLMEEIEKLKKELKSKNRKSK